ncbi:MAG: hypothetical protein IPH63_14110 [Flavobacteriales bacterium]|nr:hypothetical protein [Flavobacteriales bacterium]
MKGTERYTTAWALPVLVLASFVVHGLTFAYSAFSDDHSALWNAGVQGIPWRNGFFRPLSDLTFRIGFLLHGSDAGINRALNVVLHGINGYLLFRLIREGRTERMFAASFAALLFISYPFHQESVVWLVGRESALGAFSILAGLCILSGGSHPARSWAAAGVLLVGLLCYESAILLPVMAMPVLAKKERRPSLIAFSLALVVYVIARTTVVGWATDSYPMELISDPVRILINVPKVALRSFLPPDPDTHRQLWKGLGLAVFFLLIAVLDLRKGWKNISEVPRKWGWWLALAYAIPVLAAVSTRTSESDRFLYLPSVFLCGYAGLLITRIASRPLRLTTSAVLILGAIVLTRAGQVNWRIASDRTERILSKLPALSPGTRTFVLGLPDAYQGAFIFRNGFTEAIHLSGKNGDRYIDTDAADIHRSADGSLRVRHRGQDLVVGAKDPWYSWTGNTFEKRSNEPRVDRIE